MSNQLALPDVAKNAGINQEVWNALTTSIYPGAQVESIALAYQYCKARNLDPLKKPVHIVPMYVRDAKTGGGGWRDVIMPGIQELRTTASRTGLMAGTEAPVWGEKIEVPLTENPKVKDPDMLVVPESCTITVYRLDKAGVPRAYVHVEFFEEAVARTKDGAINSMWRKRSRGQLAKCAEAGALRKAFPEELGGVYAAEEMEGKTVGADEPITGEFTDVTGQGDDIQMPEELAAAHAGDEEPVAQQAQQQAKSEPQRQPPKEQYAVKGGEEKPAQAKAEAKSAHTIQLDAGPQRVLHSRLQGAGLTEHDLLSGFGKDINISNINEALSWIKDHAK